MRTMILLLLPAVLLAGCVTRKAIEGRYERLAAAYRLEAGLPEGLPLPAEKEAELRAEAERQIRAEAAAARQAAIAKAAEAGGRFAAGDYIGGVLTLIGLAGMGVSVVKAAKGG